MPIAGEVFSLEGAAQYCLRWERAPTIDEVGEENRDLCWRFSRAFGEAITRFLMTRQTQVVAIVDGSYWVLTKDKLMPRGVIPVVTVGTSLVRSRDHNIGISLW